MKKTFFWHVHQVLIALDQLGNTLIGGWADETLSSHCYRASTKGFWYAKVARYILDLVLSPVERDHCHQSFRSEMQRTQLPDVFRRDEEYD